jgi:hypothetical protein
LPHALCAVPPRHAPDAQHPLHELLSHAHVVPVQCRPVPQLPVVQTPPQPSSAPHAAFVQLGTQPQMPAWPPAPHVSSAAHWLFAQQDCPLPPHAPQLALPHVVPVAQTAHTVPPVPHAPCTSPGSHVETLQHPLQEVPSHAHTPVTQCWPLPHEPSWHVPPQPSAAPHALPLQSGMQPHTPAVPPPAHVRGNAQVLPAQHA